MIKNNMNKKVENRKFILKDILIPLIIGLIASMIAYQGNNYYNKQQINAKLSPLLVSIKAIVENNKQTQPVVFIYGAPVLQKIVYRDINKKNISEEFKVLYNKGDTVNIDIPIFLLEKHMKDKLMENLNLLIQNKYTDEQLYFILSNLDDFLRRYPFPEVNTTTELSKTRWSEQEILDEWKAHITKLQNWYELKNK